jgi:hypothetical protein
MLNKAEADRSSIGSWAIDIVFHSPNGDAGREFNSAAPATISSTAEITATVSLRIPTLRQRLRDVFSRRAREWPALAMKPRERRGVPWKISLARDLHRSTSASIPCSSQTLLLGSPRSLSVYLLQLPKS